MTVELVLIGLGILVCLILSGTFSAAEMSFSSCNEVRMEHESEEGNRKATRVLKILEKFDNALGAILIGNNLVNIASSSLVSVFMLLLTGQEGYTAIGTVVITLLVIIFGETIPKIMSKKNANTVAMGQSGFIYGLMILLKPIIAAVVFLVNVCSKPFGEEKGESDEEESVEELHTIIDTAETEGVLDADQTEIVQAAIDFSEISAFEVMTARVDIQAIDIEDSMEEILAQLSDASYSRLPVYEGSIDHIIGVLHMNHLYRALAMDEDVDIRTLLMEPCFVYKTVKLPKVLNELKAAKQHLAIVTDEYSGTLGIISMEDVLEQIVGEIWDETDDVEPDVVQVSETTYEMDGDMAISDFTELLGIPAEDFSYESVTVGGWCIEMLEHFPDAREHFDFAGYHFTILESGERRVEKVRAKRIPEEA